MPVRPKRETVASASKKLLKEMPTPDEMKKTLFGLLDETTDHTVAVTGASYLDYALKLLLEYHFRPLGSDERKRMFDPAGGGILGPFSARNLMAYALGLISDQIYHDLKIIIAIRNVFSHTLHKVDFTHPLIKEDCFRISIFQPDSRGLSGLAPVHDLAKTRYALSVFTIYSVLRQSADAAIRDREGVRGALTDVSPPSRDKRDWRSRRIRRPKADRKEPPRPPKPSRG